MNDKFKKARDEAIHAYVMIGSDWTTDKTDYFKEQGFMEGSSWAYNWCDTQRQYVIDGYEVGIQELTNTIEAQQKIIDKLKEGLNKLTGKVSCNHTFSTECDGCAVDTIIDKTLTEVAELEKEVGE